MYWIMLSERKDEYEYSYDNTPPLLEANNWEFDRGELIQEIIPTIEIVISPHVEERLTDNIPAYGCKGLLINNRTKQLFEQLEVNNMQYFQAHVVNIHDSSVKLEYWIANITTKTECIDRELSDLEYNRYGEIEFINALSLKISNTDIYGHIFRMAEFLSVMVVSDFLKSAMEAASISGFTFYKPEEFSL